MPDNEQKHLEETLAHHEQQIHDLSDMVSRQWDELERLTKTIQKMQSKIDILEERSDSQEGENLSVTEIAARDKPPHY